jgi:hypothetical protein
MLLAGDTPQLKQRSTPALAERDRFGRSEHNAASGMRQNVGTEMAMPIRRHSRTARRRARAPLGYRSGDTLVNLSLPCRTAALPYLREPCHAGKCRRVN